jgi:pimeloyl-ACP methyl ester carboxylesterase
MSRLRSRFVVTALVCVGTLALAACSGSGSSTDAGSSAGDPAATTTLPTSGGLAQFAGHTSEIYSQDANWLCRPGAAIDHCSQDDINATVINADGTTSLEQRQVAADAPIDCFYVYPTVNNSPGGGNDLNLADTAVETVVVDLQAARFSSVCKVYAPVYRQQNLSAYSSPAEAQAKSEAVAYGDVKDAFAYYMAHWNDGRPIVLIGHSQGSFHLTRLISDVFDKDPDMRARLVSALLLGGAVKVPPGADVGGSFQSIPLCRSNGQTGCVVTYNSYGTTPPPDAGAIFGRAQEGLVGACVNPASLGGGSAMLEPYLGKAKAGPVGASVTTRLVSLPDAISAECLTENGMSFLGITAATKPGDVRDVTSAVTNTPGWGLHNSDVDLAMGNLLDLVHAQTASLGL